MAEQLTIAGALTVKRVAHREIAQVESAASGESYEPVRLRPAIIGLGDSLSLPEKWSAQAPSQTGNRPKNKRRHVEAWSIDRRVREPTAHGSHDEIDERCLRAEWRAGR